MSNRITKTMIDYIMGRAVEKAGLKAKREDLAKRRAEWEEAVRIDSLGGPEEHARLKALEAKVEELRNSVPEGLREGAYRLVVRNGHMRLNLAGLSVWVGTGWPGRKMCAHTHTITADNPLAQQWHDLEHESDQLDSEEQQLRNQVHAAVASFTTIKKLLEHWPEVAELLPEATPKETSNLPAVVTADLNKMIGLPSETPAAS